MRTSDLKKAKLYSSQRNRPTGKPAEVLFMQDGTQKPAYGVKRGDNGTWWYLTDEGWINGGKVKYIKRWRPEIELEQKSLKAKEEFEQKQQKQEQNQNQSSIGFEATQFLVMVKVNGVEEYLATDLTGKLQTPKDGYNTIKEYLQNLTSLYGNKAVSYGYITQ